jgi:hypothetical protein
VQSVQFHRIAQLSRPALAVFVAGVLISGAVLLPTTTAEAESRTGDVTTVIPSKIVIDGSPIPVTVSSTALTGYFDRVSFALYQGESLRSYDEVALNKQVDVDPFSLAPGTVVGRPVLATTRCSVYSSDICSIDSDYNLYTFVNGLNYHDSAPAVAKYGSKISLSATNDGARTTWTAVAQRYGGYAWQAWSGALVSIGSGSVTTNSSGEAVWSEPTSELHTLTARAEEDGDVWGSESVAVTAARVPAPQAPVPPTPVKPAPTKHIKPAKPGHVHPSASARKAADALKDRVSAIRKVVTLTKRNDVNHLLGKKNGYSSAAVLYDKRASCSGGPGVDCGATIEKFSSTAKAKARARHIRKLLRQYSFLGTEYDTVHGHFLLRVTGDLSHSRAAAYKKAYLRSF